MGHAARLTATTACALQVDSNTSERTGLTNSQAAGLCQFWNPVLNGVSCAPLPCTMYGLQSHSKALISSGSG